MQTPSQPAHPFDIATQLRALSEHRFEGCTAPAYANMVGPYGGITAAQILQGVMLHPARLGEPLALTINYAGPLADGNFELVAEPLRTNRSTQHWALRLNQAGAVVATGTAVTAVVRETWDAAESERPAAPPPDDVPRVNPPRRVPWMANYDNRMVRGGPLPPTAAEAGADLGEPALQWVRDEPGRPLDHLSLAALCDVFFPQIFRRRGRWVPIGTVSFTTYFHADAAMLARVGTRHVLGQAQSHRYRKGFFDQNAQVWSADGELLAVTHQIVYYKE
jgi:acyl-CoA thioesterase